MKFARYKKNPIIKPNKKHTWESLKTYNPGAVFDGRLFHLFYRAVGLDKVSRVGYAYSRDGFNFVKQKKALLFPTDEQEKHGLEDPRITKVYGTYYMTYAAYDGDTPILSLVTSKDLINWQKHGAMLNKWDFKDSGGFIVPWDTAQIESKNIDSWSKAGGIFGETMKMKYWMLFGDRHLWLANSADGKKWKTEEKPFLSPREKHFDAVHLEMGPPPIRTKNSWLVLYHGIDKRITYRLGLLVLDLHDPRKILYRSKLPIFEPSKFADKFKMTDIFSHKQKPHIIFCNGAVLVGDTLKIYYGVGDTVICTAEIKLKDLWRKK